MKTKAEIVERLLEENHITAEEAVVLLKETEYIPIVERIIPGEIPYPFPKIDPPFEITGEEDMVPYGEICSCNPKNGGSGICGCIMANQLVPRNSKNNIYTQITTDNEKSFIKPEGCPNAGGACFCDGSCKKQE